MAELLGAGSGFIGNPAHHAPIILLDAMPGITDRHGYIETVGTDQGTHKPTDGFTSRPFIEADITPGRVVATLRTALGQRGEN